MDNKIAIFTLQGLVNYGNRLQNYAVEQLIKEYGFKPESIIVTNHPIIKPIQQKAIRMHAMIFGNHVAKIEAQRQELFSRFNQHLHVKYYNYNRLGEIDNKYYKVLVGSDQVWNPSFNSNNIFLLSFTNKKICLSPSFGIDDVNSLDKEKYSNALRGFKNLSVREDSGGEIIYELTGRRASILVDPTMAIDPSRWKSLEIKPKKFNADKFILSYTLGELTDNRKLIVDQAQRHFNCEHIEIFDDLKENKYVIGPCEFLWLIHHAEFVITDSFHASVFSILFEKNFITIPRYDKSASMYDRISTLLRTFSLESQDLQHFNEAKSWEVDYTNCKAQIIKEREKIDKYLKISLGIE